MRLMSGAEMNQLLPAETHAFRGPRPSNRRYGYVIRRSGAAPATA